jgi:O-antigen/teichoic acid export membrane protein
MARNTPCHRHGQPDTPLLQYLGKGPHVADEFSQRAIHCPAGHRLFATTGLASQDVIAGRPTKDLPKRSDCRIHRSFAMTPEKHVDPRWLERLPSAIRNRIIGRPHLQRVIGNTGWLIADNVIRIFLGLLVGIWVTRYLGPEAFGQFNYALAIVGMLAVVATLGMDSILVRALVKEPDRRDEILGTGFWLRLGAGILMACTAILAAIFLRPEDHAVRNLTAILSGTMIFVSAETASLWFQANTQSKYTVIARNTAYILGASLKVSLILLKQPLMAFAWVALLESAISAFLLLTLYFRYTGASPLVWRMAIPRAMEQIRQGWPLLIAALNIVVYRRIDTLMLGQMTNNYTIGVFTAASRLSEFLYVIPMVIMQSLNPTLIKNQAALKKNSIMLYGAFLGTSLILAFLISLASPYVVSVLYGERYVESAGILRIHIWTIVPIFIGVVVNNVLVIEGKEKLIAIRTFIGVLSNVVLNIILIPSYGAQGAAMATLASFVLVTFSVAFFPESRWHWKAMLCSPRTIFEHFFQKKL